MKQIQPEGLYTGYLWGPFLCRTQTCDKAPAKTQSKLKCERQHASVTSASYYKWHDFKFGFQKSHGNTQATAVYKPMPTSDHFGEYCLLGCDEMYLVQRNQYFGGTTYVPE